MDPNLRQSTSSGRLGACASFCIPLSIAFSTLSYTTGTFWRHDQSRILGELRPRGVGRVHGSKSNSTVQFLCREKLPPASQYCLRYTSSHAGSVLTEFGKKPPGPLRQTRQNLEGLCTACI